MAGFCVCCSALKPRYKRLVDNIFPANPQDGLVKSNMEKLTFYALSSRPEKLDRIGQYLERKLSTDISRHRNQYVFISMEILDQLLVSCHAHSLNLFVESFLKMVQKLLECGDPKMQIRATQSFVKFANVEEDAPSYHRRYDFFVSKFSSLCHNNHQDVQTCRKLRQAGLKGLQGVVRKTISDDLQVNIWEAVHMDKIVPSLLFNMQESNHGSDGDHGEADTPQEDDDPAHLAEVVFRDLICRASYGNIKSVLSPVLTHLDNHNLWVPNDFAIRLFKIIMFSVQSQYGYLVVQMLLSHVDKNAKSDPRIKTCIVTVLYEAVLISAGNSTGPSVLEVFNNLLRHLRISIDRKSSDEHQRNEEIKFEEVVVNTIGEFANNLPDYQKIEIMMFVLGKFPQFTNEEEIGKMDKQLSFNLLRTLLKVATKYKTVSLSQAFPPEFLHPLLRISLIDDPGMRIIVQEILHTLLDRHGNSFKLKHISLPEDISSLHLTIKTNDRHDLLFMKKSGMQLYWHILENLQLESNKVDNFEAIYCTMCLLGIEVGQDEVIIELVRLALDIQQMTLSSSLPKTHICAIHSLVVAFLNMLGQVTQVNALSLHALRVAENRENEAPYLLPDFAFNRKNRPNSYPKDTEIKESCLFHQDRLAECLRSAGLDVTRLSTPFSARPNLGYGVVGSGEGGTSVSDVGSINIDFENTDGSPRISKKTDEITVESLKKMLAEDSSAGKAEEERHRREIVHMFRSAPFEEIVARSEAISNHFHSKLNEILEIVSQDRIATEPQTQEIVYPKLFVY
ncbi:protein EFR3 homolog B-like isoform X3 [Biomphalaria glabrata]|uniref:Protein EFR3 homolog B-like isoform X3 n=2 Tax=Biomphalaria glabrata TaxID=6526 RepID=A0A9W3AI29_BIOGL|nr:protein EFR3 homolog B-like isoform X3 [Biomphalaria glabrata]